MKKNWKKFVVVLSVLTVFASSAWAVQSEAERQTFFNNVTDFIATVGKSDQDAAEIQRERRAQRKAQRLRDANRRQRVQTRQRMNDQAEEIMRKERAPFN